MNTLTTAAEAKVSVGVRVRPLIEREKTQKDVSESDAETGINWSVERQVIQQIEPKGKQCIGLPYTFDHVFSMNQSTKEVYDRVVAPIVDQAFSGFNGTILCYGQTSSGKTYTLYGNDTEEGMLSLTAQHLFNRISQDRDRTYIIRVGLIEIYNEKVTDLLSEKPQTEVQIVEVNGSVVPKCLEEIEILKPEDMLNTMKLVQQKRRVGETRMNQESSRSHTILRILMESVPRIDEGNDSDIELTRALLNFVDLAGSEKVSQTMAIGERLKEATFINKSLSVLSQVVMQLSQEDTGNGHGVSVQTFSNASAISKKSSKFVNYRDSKLTRILQSSLSGNAYIAMICTVTPASVEETISTLRFARTAKRIQTKPMANHMPADCFEYQQKINNLQRILEGKSTEINDLKRQLDVFMKFSRRAVPDDRFHIAETLNPRYADTQVQTVDLPPEPKRIRLDEDAAQTPPASLRIIRSQLRLALDHERNDKLEFKAFADAEVGMLKAHNEALQQQLAHSESRRLELEKILESVGAENGEVAQILSTLKNLLERDVRDVSIETRIETEDFGTTVEKQMLDSCDAWTETHIQTADSGVTTDSSPGAEATEIGVNTEEAKIECFDAFTEMTVEMRSFGVTTEACSTAEVGINTEKSKAESRDASTETSCKTRDFGTETDEPVSELRQTCHVSTETFVEMRDSGVMTDSNGKVQTAEVGVSTEELVADPKDALNENVAQSKHFGATELPISELCDASTETFIEIKDFGTLTDLIQDVETVNTGTNTEEEPNAKYCDAITETETCDEIEIVDTGVNTEYWKPESCDASTQILEAILDIPISDPRDATTETSIIEVKDFGATTHSCLTANTAINTEEEAKPEFIEASTQFFVETRNCGVATERLGMSNVGCNTEEQKPKSFDASTEVSFETKDFGTVTEANPTADTEMNTDQSMSRCRDASTVICFETRDFTATTNSVVETTEKGINTQELLQVRPIRVNRQAQTGRETGYDDIVAHNREIRIQCMKYKRKLEIAEKDFKEKLDDEKNRFRKLESEIVLKDTEKENLEAKILYIQNAQKHEKSVETQSVQCELFKDLLDKALRGCVGALPEGYERVARLASDNQRLLNDLQKQAWEKRKKEREEEEAAIKNGKKLRFEKPKLYTTTRPIMRPTKTLQQQQAQQPQQEDTKKDFDLGDELEKFLEELP